MITRCFAYQERSLKARFDQVASSFELHHPFNPSFYRQDGLEIFAFRAAREGDDDLVSYVSIISSKARKDIELSGASLGIPEEARLIDPKVFQLRDGFYVTFHNGWVPGGK